MPNGSRVKNLVLVGRTAAESGADRVVDEAVSRGRPEGQWLARSPPAGAGRSARLHGGRLEVRKGETASCRGIRVRQPAMDHRRARLYLRDGRTSNGEDQQQRAKHIYWAIGCRHTADGVQNAPPQSGNDNCGRSDVWPF
jgi:hypothetical protein